MKKRSIGLIIGLMGFALLGVMAMQLYFLSQTYNLQSQLFDGQISEALKNVIDKIDRLDKARFFISHNPQVAGPQQIVNAVVSRDTGHSNGLHFVNRKTIIRDSLKKLSKRLAIEVAKEHPGPFVHRRSEKIVDQDGRVYEGVTVEVSSDPAKLQRFDTLGVYEYDDPQLGYQRIPQTQINPLWEKEQKRQLKIRQLRLLKRRIDQDSLVEVKTKTDFDNIADEYQAAKSPLPKRLNLREIDSLLKFELLSRGIDMPYSFEVSTANNDSLIFSNVNNVTGERASLTKDNKPYQTPIFASNVVNDPGKLRLSFPNKRILILSGMGMSLGTSAGLLLILIFCFGYTIFSILRQKKISEMKTDFINNMTHEFKTPVSTIMIASEALKDAEIASDQTRIARLANIIYEENARLGSHIERVLNIAKIEKDDFKLDIKPVEVNETITAVVDSMSLKLQKYSAEIELNLNAEYSTINADELHFSNVLYNLVDNAIKYSKDAPQITVSTSMARNTLIITVADKGIGMSREEQARIFEQFYRIPTGNLHDVKGFGLGLSYVNTIVRRLDGSISVKSEKDKGSEFELRFPVV